MDRATFGNFHFRKRTLRGRAMPPQRTNSGQRKGSCRATNLGTFRDGARTILPFPHCVKRQPSAPTNPLARVVTQPPLRIRPSAPYREAWRDVAAVFRPAVRASLRASVPALTPAEAGSPLHRQVSSKVRASMLCSLPFLRHTCPPVPHDVPENPLDVSRRRPLLGSSR